MRVKKFNLFCKAGERPGQAVDLIDDNTGASDRCGPRQAECQINLRDRKPGDGEIGIQRRQRFKFDTEDIPVPSGVLDEFIVSQDIGAPFIGIQMQQPEYS